MEQSDSEVIMKFTTGAMINIITEKIISWKILLIQIRIFWKNKIFFFENVVKNEVYVCILKKNLVL